VIDVQRVDFIRVPVTDMDQANHFYGEVLGLERNPNSPAEDWVEYELGNVTLAVMTPHTPTTTSPRRCRPGRLPYASPTWRRRRRSWRRQACRSMRCGTPASATAQGSETPPATPFSSTTATPPTGRADALAAWASATLGGAGAVSR
jgi:hypothetical protein